MTTTISKKFEAYALRGPKAVSRVTYKLLVVSTILLFAIGCVDLQVETRFKSNGSGVQIWHFTSSALMATQIKKYVDSHPLLKHGKKILDEYKKGEYWLSLEVPFKKITELQDESREVHFETKGLFIKTSIYSETWKKKLSGRAGPIAEQAGAILPIKVKWQVMMPGTIQESNADEIRGSTAEWNLTLTDFAAAHTFSARSSHWNVPLLSIMTAGTLVAFFGVWVALRKRARKKRTHCLGCGTIISVDAVFCSKCGKSQKEPN